MSICRRNAEGYSDPTAYDALLRVWAEEKRTAFRPLVFICSPYAGDTDTNIQNARRFCRFAVEQNCIPIAPHLLFPQFLDDANASDRAAGLFFGKVLLGKCTELWVFGEEITAGMAAEIVRAKYKGLAIRQFYTNCQEVIEA